MEENDRAKSSFSVGDEDKHSLGEIADLIQEELESHPYEKEVFEQYAHTLRAHLFVNKQKFRNQLIRGYEILLKDLDADSKISD